MADEDGGIRMPSLGPMRFTIDLTDNSRHIVIADQITQHDGMLILNGAGHLHVFHLGEVEQWTGVDAYEAGSITAEDFRGRSRIGEYDLHRIRMLTDAREEARAAFEQAGAVFEEEGFGEESPGFREACERHFDALTALGRATNDLSLARLEALAKARVR